MAANFEKSLSLLRGVSAEVSTGDEYPETGQASIKLLFANRTRLRAAYWRLIADDKAGMSSFDHQQKYGLPVPIDAVKSLCEILQDKPVTNALLDRRTGDLLFEFGGGTTLQVLNFTGYEIWELNFPEGTVEYSNYAK
jgi:hypothetical protein